jgi:hypothetical protein
MSIGDLRPTEHSSASLLVTSSSAHSRIGAKTGKTCAFLGAARGHCAFTGHCNPMDDWLVGATKL